MTLEQVKTIGVLGAGVMGRGIALISAMKGYDVVLFDINTDIIADAQKYFDSFLSKSIERGKITEDEKPVIINRIKTSTQLEDVKAEVVVEAIPEILDLKREVLGKVEEINGGKAIIASNTSTIPITRIAAGLKNPANCVGMHFFNPAPIMKLIEVISGEETSDQVADLIVELSMKLGKQPVRTKDEPGFIVNRVARNYYLESLKLVEESRSSFAGVDRLLESSGFRMGPFKLMDLIGVETNHSVTLSLYDAFFQDEKFRPSRVQQKKVDAGHYGRKSGRGFYEY